MKGIIDKNQWYGFTEDKVFGWLMEDYRFCKFVLQTVLPELEIDEIEMVQSQKEINDPDPDTKDVRFDILVKDKHGVYYDVEMQVVDKHNLGRRMRYYSSKLDRHYGLKKGETYNDLRETYIIFLCDFDFFGKNKLRYSFHYYEDSDRSIMLPDGTHKIIINDRGRLEGNSKNLQDLVRLMRNEKIVDGNEMFDFAQNKISEINRDPKRRDIIMEYEVKLKAREQLGERKTAQILLKKSVINYRNLGASDEQILRLVLEDYSEYLSPKEIKEIMKNT